MLTVVDQNQIYGNVLTSLTTMDALIVVMWESTVNQVKVLYFVDVSLDDF